MDKNLNDLLINFNNSSNLVELQPQWFDRALEISEKFDNPSRQFNLYLQVLALSSFESWLDWREPSLKVDVAKSSVFKPELANILDVVHNVKVEDFRVCIIPILDGIDSEIFIPRYVVDIPEFTAHFYVIVEINEELELGTIKGFIDYNRLISEGTNYVLDIDWNYALPSNLLTTKVEKLLVNLQYLETNAIVLPKKSSDRTKELIKSAQSLQQILPEIKTAPLWQKLTWSQAILVITNSDLCNWLYQSVKQSSYNYNLYLKDLFNFLTQQATNLSDWIQNKINTLEKELAWHILPVAATSDNFRSIDLDNPVTNLDEILTQIREVTNLDIPSHAGRAYQQLDDIIPLRLYAVTWLVSKIQKTWSLLLVLGSNSSLIPPYGVKLRISDRYGILQEQELTPDLGVAYLCTKLEAETSEKLLVTITTADSKQEISRLFEFIF